MNEKMQALRKEHRQAIIEGKTWRAAWIREEIREHAKQAFKKGYTLEQLY